MVARDASAVVCRSMVNQARHRSAETVRQAKRGHQAMVRMEGDVAAVAATVAAALVVVLVVVETVQTVPSVPFASAAAAPAAAV